MTILAEKNGSALNKMASPIPTFTSKATTQIPNMGIVSMSGDRAMAQSMTAVSGIFDKVAEYNNQKLDEKVKRDMEILAQDTVRYGGLNPKDLDEPYTMADKIYREAALNTYGIQVESNIDQTLNRIQIESKYNPEGYKAKATKFLEGTMSELAPEMKNGVEKYTLGKINSTYSSIAAETQRKALAEAEMAAANHREKIIADLVNASPEERETVYSKLEANVYADPSNITPEGKKAVLDDAQRKVLTQINLVDVMNSNKSIPEALESLKAGGVMITPSLKQQLYSTSMIEYNYQQQLANQEIARKRAQAGEVQDAFYETILDANLDESQVLMAAEETQKTMREIGVPAEEVLNFKAQAMRTFYGSQVENKDVIAIIEDKIARGDPDAIPLTKEAVRTGAIKNSTSLGLIRNAEAVTNDVVKTPDVQRYIAQDLRNKFSNATPFTGLRPSDAASADQKQKIEADTVAYYTALSEISGLVNNSEQPMSPKEAIAQIRGTENAADTQSFIPMTSIPESPQRNQVHALVNDPQPQIMVYDQSRPLSDRIAPLTYSDINKIDMNTEIGRFQKGILEQWGDGKFNNQNALSRLKVMNQQNQEAIRNGGKAIYDYEQLNTIMKFYGIQPEDIR